MFQRFWRAIVSALTFQQYVEYLTTLPQDLAAPGNPRATVYPHPDAAAVLLSGTGNTEAPPPLQAGMPECCAAVWHDSAGQRRVDGQEYEE